MCGNAVTGRITLIEYSHAIYCRYCNVVALFTSGGHTLPNAAHAAAERILKPI